MRAQYIISYLESLHPHCESQIPPTMIPFNFAETKSTTNGRTNLYSGSTEPRTNNYINPDHGFPSVHNHFWKSCVCNYTSQGNMVTVPSNTSGSLGPSDDRFLYCPSWVEKSAKTCPNHLSVETNRSPVGPHESQLADFALSEESLQLDGPDLPSSQSSVLDIEPCIDSNLTSEEFLFSWP